MTEPQKSTQVQKAILSMSDWSGQTKTEVLIVSSTESHHLIRAIVKTRIPGINKFINPVETAYIIRRLIKK